jgi:hypothetical protein
MPETKLDAGTDIREHVRTLRSPQAVEAAVREWNTRIVPDAQEKARHRVEERERYVLRRGHELREQWEAEQRRMFARQAGEEFDAGRPPVAVPERLEMDEARRIAAERKKAR